MSLVFGIGNRLLDGRIGGLYFIYINGTFHRISVGRDWKALMMEEHVLKHSFFTLGTN